MSTLVTGTTGFIGAEIVRMLVDRGEGPVRVAHRFGNLGRCWRRRSPSTAEANRSN